MWMKHNGGFLDWENWADGYGAFTYSFSDKDKMIAYVKNQKEHHRKLAATKAMSANFSFRLLSALRLFIGPYIL